MLHIGLMFDYHNRARALHQMTNDVAQRRQKLIDREHSHEKRTQPRDVNWWPSYVAQLEYDEHLLANLQQLWSLPGMTRQHNPRRLSGRKYVKYAERVLQMYRGLDSQTDLSEIFIREEIARTRWQYGMEYNPADFQPTEETTVEDSSSEPEGSSFIGPDGVFAGQNA